MSGFEGVQEDEAWSVVETKKPSQKKTEVKPRPGQGKRKYDRSKDSVQEKGPARGSKASDSKPKSTTSKTGSETQSTNETKKTTNKVIEVIKNIESVEQVAKDLKAMSLEEVSTTTDPVPVEESLPSVPSPAPVVKNVYKNMAEALKNGLSGMDEIPADNVLSESMHTLPSSSSSGTMVVGNKISVLEFSILSQQFNFSSRNVMEDNKVYKITRSLANSGNACFRNCIYQALFALPPFKNMIDFYLLRIGHQINNFPSPGFSIWRELLLFADNFFVNPLSLQSTGKSKFGGGGRVISVEPCNADYYFQHLVDNFYSYVANNGNIIFQEENADDIKPKAAGSKKKTRSQQDAMEFLTFLLDSLHEESKAAEKDLGEDDQNSLKLLKAEARYRIDRIGDEEEKGFEEVEQGGWNTVSNRFKVVVDEKSKEIAVEDISSTIINRLFHGLLRSEVIYKSKKVCSVTFQRFHCITLALSELGSRGGAGDKRLLLTDALNHYFEEENIDEGSVKKQVRLESLPEILILHLGRFSFDYQKFVPLKLQVPIEYPATLSIPKSYMSENLSSTLADESVDYELHAAVLHHGKKATGGHYSVYVQDFDNSGWRSMNDTRVNSITEDHALSAHEMVYIMFYCRKR